MKKINLKKQIKKNPFILAPMDAVTDIGFRELCEENKASYTVSELTSVESLIRDKVPKYRYQKRNLKINAVQLFGSNPQTFKQALEKIEEEKQADIIDINFGCPSPAVTRNESGSSLLKDPKNVGKIVETITNNTNLPVTAKIRLGYTKTNFVEVAKQIEDAGADLITLHARTAKQKYSGIADWTKIKELYGKTNLPLVGNGDIKEEEQIDKYLNSHCDGLMIGRAAIGNPLIFKKFQHYYKKGKKLEFKDIKQEQKKAFVNYLKKIENIQFTSKHLKIRQQAMWFMKGIKGAKELRKELVKENDVENMISLVEEF